MSNESAPSKADIKAEVSATSAEGQCDASNEGPSEVHHFNRSDSSTASEESSNNGRWTAHEHEQFLAGYDKFGKDWKRISEFMGTRTNIQCRTHAQKFFKKRGYSETFPDKAESSAGSKRIQEESDADSTSSAGSQQTKRILQRKPDLVQRTTPQHSRSAESFGTNPDFRLTHLQTTASMAPGMLTAAHQPMMLPSRVQPFPNFGESLASQQLVALQRPLLDLFPRPRQVFPLPSFPYLTGTTMTMTPTTFQHAPMPNMGMSAFAPAPFLRFPLPTGSPAFFGS